MKAIIACLPLVLLTACATPLRSYQPAAHQEVEFNQGIGAVTWQGDGAVLTMYPTFHYQSPGDIPTFTLMVQNTTNHDIDFVPETITASLDGHPCHVYTLDEHVSEIRRAARRKQITLAVLGGVAAGASAYAASHSSTTYTSFGAVGHRSFYSTGTIFQHTTIHPGMTVVGQVMVRAAPKRPSPIAGGRAREVGVAVSLLRPASLRTPQDGQQNKTQTSGYREHELHHVCPLRCNFPRCILNGTIRLRSRAPPTAM